MDTPNPNPTKGNQSSSTSEDSPIIEVWGGDTTVRPLRPNIPRTPFRRPAQNAPKASEDSPSPR
jgi:hypothetical protein